MKCPGHAEVGEREDQDDLVKGKFNWKETFKADLRQGPDNRIAIEKLGENTASQYLVTSEHHKAKEEILTNSKKNISKKCHTSVTKRQSQTLEQFCISKLNPIYY